MTTSLATPQVHDGLIGASLKPQIDSIITELMVALPDPKQLTAEDLQKTIYIRNQGHTVMEAINRQLAHYPYHVGQIVYIAKMATDGNWKSLTIPKGNSRTFNSEKFSKPKSKQHFTDELLKERKK